MFDNFKYFDFEYWDFPGLVRAFGHFAGIEDIDFIFDLDKESIATVCWNFEDQAWNISGSLVGLLTLIDDHMVQVAAHEIGHIVCYHFRPNLTRSLLRRVINKYIETLEEREADKYAERYAHQIK